MLHKMFIDLISHYCLFLLPFSKLTTESKCYAVTLRTLFKLSNKNLIYPYNNIKWFEVDFALSALRKVFMKFQNLPLISKYHRQSTVSRLLELGMIKELYHSSHSLPVLRHLKGDYYFYSLISFTLIWKDLQLFQATSERFECDLWVIELISIGQAKSNNCLI